MATRAPVPTNIRDHARSLSADVVENLDELVTAESPSGDVAGLATVADLIEELFESSGADIERVRGVSGDHLVVSWGHERTDPGGHILLVGHHDTALPVGTIDKHPFRLTGDTLTGPGVYDMKGAIVGVRLAMRLLHERRAHLASPVRLVLVNDEEIGSPEGARVIAREAEGAVAAIGLEPALVGNGLKVGRRGVARVRVAVRGVEAHSGLDAARGVSAIDELIDQLVWIRKSIPATSGAHVNVGTIGGGTRANVVAGRAEAELGLRFDSASAERFAFARFDAMQALLTGADITTEVLSSRPTWDADASNPLAARLVAKARELGIDLVTGVSGGAGDTNALGNTSVPTVDGMGPDGAGAHSPTERASLRSLLDRAALLAQYLTTDQREIPSVQS
jgi:glutamate carboxypeptidase